MTNYFLFAGEASGDLHGSDLMKSLKLRAPHFIFSGVGGPLMRSEGIIGPLMMEDFQVMGFTDVLKALPKLWRSFYIIRDFILKTGPDAVILIDYPGFNLRMARALRKRGFTGKIVQYICPTVWAHGKKRIDTMKENLDLLMTIYPFESSCFAHTHLKVEYVGNPLAENYRKWNRVDDWKSMLDIPTTDNLIALFPGSRISEVVRHAPIQLKAAALLKQAHPEIHFAMSYAHDALLPLIEALIAQSGLDISLVPPHLRYDLMHDCETAMAMSGTVTLELAMHDKPTVMMCELSSLNYMIAKYILRLKLPHYCIVNILGGKEIYPELIGTGLDPKNLAEVVSQLHFDGKRRSQIKEDCNAIKQALGELETHQAAAEAIIRLVS